MARQSTVSEGRTKTALTVKIELQGARETLAAFRRLPKEANQALREGSLKLAQTLAGKAQAAARSDSAQSALIAPTIKANRDRVPAITAGGSKRVGRNRVPAFKVLFGAEFGADRYRQFRPHLGRQGYWFFPLVESEEAEISKQWNAVADEIVDRFSEGGE